MSDNDNIYLLQGVSEELNEENKKLNQSTSQLTLLMEKMRKEFGIFKQETDEAQRCFQEEVIERLDSAANKLALKAHESFTKRTLADSNDAIKSLKDMSFKAATQITEATKKTKLNFKKLSAFIVAGSLFGGLVGGVVGGTIMRYYPKLDDYVEERYTWGRALERSWKELSKAEQTKIQKLLTKNTR